MRLILPQGLRQTCAASSFASHLTGFNFSLGSLLSDTELIEIAKKNFIFEFVTFSKFRIWNVISHVLPLSSGAIVITVLSRDFFFWGFFWPSSSPCSPEISFSGENI